MKPHIKIVKYKSEVRFYLDNKQPLATITYKDNKVIDGKCANNKKIDDNVLDSISDYDEPENITDILKEYCK